jgi:RND family efflux transporter MFP subunit
MIQTKRLLKPLALVGLMGLGAAAVLMGEGTAGTDPSATLPVDRPQPVRVVEVLFRPPVSDTTYTGTVRPRWSSAMGFRITGKITERLVETGQFVSPGEALARLDETDIHLSIAALEAEIEAARSNLDRLRDEVARNNRLFNAGHVSQAALDRVETERDQAQAHLDATARGLDQTRNQLGYTTLSADHAGVVTAVTAEAGQVVEAGTPVITVARMDALDAVVAIPEQKRFGLELMTASATLWGGPDRTYALVLREVSPDVDPVSRTYTARFTLEAPDAGLSLGRTLTVRLSPPEAAPVATLPLAAVMNDGRGPAVWKVADDRVSRQPVTIAALTGETALIADGLASGDHVVSLGVHKIDPGRPIRIVESFPPPALP